jgi:hypothetical protein
LLHGRKTVVWATDVQKDRLDPVEPAAFRQHLGADRVEAAATSDNA